MLLLFTDGLADDLNAKSDNLLNEFTALQKKYSMRIAVMHFAPEVGGYIDAVATVLQQKLIKAFYERITEVKSDKIADILLRKLRELLKRIVRTMILQDSIAAEEAKAEDNPRIVRLRVLSLDACNTHILMHIAARWMQG